MQQILPPTRLWAGEESRTGILTSRTPTLTWLPPVGLPEQTAYEIETRWNGDAPQLHRVAGSAPRADWPFGPVPSRTSLTVRVRVAAGENWSPWTQELSVCAALWDEEDWTGRWISPPQDDAASSERGAWDLHSSFELADIPARAVLYATALGVYEVAVNGERVGDIELAPGFTSYHATLYAQAYDVTALLRRGDNTVTFTVSDGWFRGRGGGRQLQNIWGKALAVRAQLETGDEHGGAVTAAATGSAWTARPSSITRADLMRGQATDLRLAASPQAAVPVRVDAVTAPTPSWSPAPPVRRVAQWQPRSVTALCDGVSIVDAGQNISGRLRLAHLGASGAHTTMTFAEHLASNGDVTTEHLDMVAYDGEKLRFSQIDEVVSDGEAREFEPRHTVHGFRYARVTHPDRTLRADDCTVVAVHSDLERRGWFRCSEPDLERLHRAAEWSFRGNIVDVPTDCPTRERSGWTGDFGLFAPVAAQLYDISGFADKWLRSVRDDQLPDGVPAMFSPDTERVLAHPEHPGRAAGGSAGWGDALVDVPWTLYTEYGDTRILADSWDSMRWWVEYALRCAKDIRHPTRGARSTEPAPHERYIWDGPFHFGEWCEPRRRDDPPLTLADVMAHDQGEVATAYLHRSLTRLAAIATALDRPADSAHYGALSDRVRDAWRTEFLRPDGRTAADSQAGYVRALAFGLVPDQLRDAAADRLVALIHDNDDRLATGFLTSGLLLPTLADSGHPDLAYTLLLRRGIPSWLGMLDRGASTVWEEWEGVDADGQAHASLNHYSKGAVIQFLHAYVAGLRQRPASVGWERFTIRPHTGGGLTSAHFRHLTPRGEIDVNWRIDAGQFELEVTVPATASAEISLPNGDVHHRGVGHHLFTCPA
ncbi:family 78 glycoside hydrolase catalytic domain [Streptomyces sp. SID8361]|uniref:family 78 glycoside hydrolase catalytic domain n=1 Tax=Streptomyces sp. MnatMP-M27 TaxID=1839768 RepID=UPI00081F1DDF|nr:family 78 glycoside hydrolase catalytic domain [Streptomyces sp. MnatMP-M27]MYU16951.1 family 78 glycoside hydrolase catalytic domain [Streptomyces sp. SID8361]SCG11522.1 alpha-L-rhamnosidase [Streptomyces sp. MnatMP-M27]